MSLFIYFSICETYCTLSGRYTDAPLSALRNLLDRAGSALEALERRQREEAGQHED